MVGEFTGELEMVLSENGFENVDVKVILVSEDSKDK